ncbi:uncharacterized protein BJ212DRAFT_1477136 [Suillus subaureus]|uniref:Uncharacterized protein n=1 Tax=Suillus subaureus TaxID=48587 RepID=A0A9P7EIC9_9AGAM|nr:uncharacterized protein BJ212DRAFT_1477136 [Suillus subaureus]KAG1822721.1 hypothetical protein BJ212DRAFT_1477136 [Suillus subaureus]
MSQYCITPAEVIDACVSFAEWEQELEEMYYQHCIDNIHFICPCVHLSNHITQEATHVGAPSCSSQWPLEQTIRDIKFNLCQPSNAMANFTEICVLCCQVNALKAILPQFDTNDNLHPHGSFNVGDGYVLLHGWDKKPQQAHGLEAAIISDFLHCPAPKFRWWSCLRLPNGQIACSTWREKESSAENVRTSHNAKFHVHGIDCFGEVQYFMQLAVEDNEPEDVDDELYNMDE